MKKLAAIFVLGILTLNIVGCETTKGLGRDVENAGEELEDAVD